MKRVMFLCFVFCAVNFPTHAQVAPSLLGAIKKIYNAQFSAANIEIGQHIQSHPHDPAGYILRGIANEWYQTAMTDGTGLNSVIMADYQKARKLAEEALEKDKNDAGKKTLLGNALMYVSKKNLDMGYRSQAAFTLKMAKNLMEEVIAVEPANAQAYFAVGMFNYFAAKVPPGFRWLANLIGFKGSAAKGLTYIKKAAATPNLSQGDAQYMLVYIYSSKEKNYPAALQYADQLYRSYPDNHIFLFNLAEMQFRTKKVAPARANFQKFFDFCASRSGACSQKYLYLANYFMTWSYMDEQDYKNAKKYHAEAVKLDTKKYADRMADLKKWGEILR